jgi:hypothetical protein
MASFKSFIKGSLPVVGGIGGGIAGSFIPGVGTAAGAAMGSGLGGALSAGLGAGQRSGGEFTAVDQTLGLDPATARQSQLQLSRLQNAALGRGPSISHMALASARDAGLNQLEAQAASDRRNPALARRTAMIQGGLLNTRLTREGIMGRLAEQQQAEQALAQSIHSARQADLQRANIYEQARTARYNGAMGQPTNFERASNVLASTLPMVGQLSQGSTGGNPVNYGQAGSAGHASAMGDAMDTASLYQPSTQQGTWVPTGPYGQGYYK